MAGSEVPDEWHDQGNEEDSDQDLYICRNCLNAERHPDQISNVLPPECSECGNPLSIVVKLENSRGDSSSSSSDKRLGPQDDPIDRPRDGGEPPKSGMWSNRRTELVVEESQDLPTAARKAGSTIAENPHLDERLKNGDKLVRRADAIETRSKVQEAAYNAGKDTGRDLERQRILDLINQLEEKYESGETPFDSYETAAIRPFVKDLRSEIASVEKKTGDSE